mgnify:CR=1 FL=1
MYHHEQCICREIYHGTDSSIFPLTGQYENIVAGVMVIGRVLCMLDTLFKTLHSLDDSYISDERA